MKTAKPVLAFVMAVVMLSLWAEKASAQPTTLRLDAWTTDNIVHDIAQKDGIIYIGGEFTKVFMPAGNGAMLSTRTALPFPLPKVNGAINAVVSDGAGGWFVGGNFTSVGSFDHRRLIHIRANGTLDVTWKPDPNQTVFALALHGDKLYVGGDFTSIGIGTQSSISRLAALDAASGQVDPDWNPKPDGTVRALAVEGSIIYAGGSFSNIDNDRRNRLAAIDSVDGDATEWNPDITGTQVNTIAVAGTTVYVGGIFTNVGAQGRNHLAAISAVNGIPLSWNPNPTGGAPTLVQALAVSGSIVYVGGSFTAIGAVSSGLPQPLRSNLAALKVSTGEVTGRTPDANGQVNTLMANGATVYVGGAFTTIGGKTQAKIVAIDTSGAMSATWNPDLGNTSPTTFISALAVSGVTIYAGGSFSINVTLPRNRLAAFDVSTGRPTNWNPDITSGAVRALAVSGSRVYAGGSFTKTAGNVTRNKLAVFEAGTGNLIKTWNPDPTGDINAIDLAGNMVYVGGVFNGIGRLTPRTNMNVAVLDSTVGNGTPWNTPSFRKPNTLNSLAAVNAVAVRGPAVYVGGDFTAIGGTERNFLAALDAANGNLLEWDPKISASSSTTDFIQALAVSGTTVYAGGKFSTPRNSIVAIDAVSGIPLNTWDANVQTGSGSGLVRAITIDGSVVYIGGTFDKVKSVPRTNAANVKLANGDLLDWIPELAGGSALSVNAIEIGGATIFAGGSFTTVAGATHNFFAPLGETPQNPVPSLFSISQTAGERLQTLTVIFDGENFIDGFTTINAGDGIAVNSLAVTNSTLTANISISESAAPGTRLFSVTNNPPGGGTSAALPFTINNPAPTAENLNPTSAQQAKTLDVAITGSNFISGVTTVSFGPGITVNSLFVTSSRTMMANITISASAAIGGREVRVINAAPGGGTAPQTLTFTVNHPAPTLTGISPASGDRLQTLEVIFSGTGFISGVTNLNVGPGITVNSVTVNSSTSLVANLTITALAATGKRNFSVTNGGPDGASENRVFTVNNPAPGLTEINPASAGRGQTHDIILKGTNFFSGASTVSFGPDITVNSIIVNSHTQLTAKITIPLGVELGDRTVSVSNPAPGGGSATLQDGFAVKNPRPTLLSLTPTIGSLGQRLEVELNGAYFIDGVTGVDFDEGIEIESMTVVNSTQIIATITIQGAAPEGGHDISVINDEPGGGGFSLPNAFTVTSGAIVHFSAPMDAHGAAGDTVEVRLRIDPSGRRVGSFDAKLSFDPQVLAYVDFRPSSLLADWAVDANGSASAVKAGGYAQSAPLTDAGTAVILRFLVLQAASLGTTAPLTLSRLTATDGNAKALPTDGTDGLFTVSAAATISGKILYFINQKPLADVIVQLRVADPEETKGRVTTENGDFEFKELPLGRNMILTPRRVSSDFAAVEITADDAGKAFRGRANGPQPLTGPESLAADVNGDCQITSGDALAILKRSTGSFENFRRFVPEDWRFVDAGFNLTSGNFCAAPKSRFYEPFQGGQFDQNFTGILLGDVNGSFGAPLGKIAGGHGEKQVIVALTDPSFHVGSDQITFAIAVSRAEKAYNSFNLTFTFEAAIQVTNVELGSLISPENWLMDWNAKQPGVLRIGGFSMTEAAITGDGALVVIHATLTHPAKEGESLRFDMPSAVFSFDGRETPAQADAPALQLTAALPQQYAIEQNYPNPFLRRERSSGTTIKYALPEAAPVQLRIYDVLGQVVRTLVSQSQKAGVHTVIWNGRKDDGSPAVSGVYFYRLEAGKFKKTNKLVLH